MRIAALIACAVVLAACDTPEPPKDEDADARQACIDDNLPADGHGFESDDTFCASPPPGEPDPGCPPVTPADIATECDDDGNPCDANAFITRDAALCIAEVEMLTEGIEGWRANLVYNSMFHRPIWSVEATTLDDPDNCEKRGEGMMFDAETGERLDRYDWQSIC